MTSKAWKQGRYLFHVAKLEQRVCKRSGCANSFNVKPFDPKQFCSMNCAAMYNNKQRVQFSNGLPEATRTKISIALQGRTSIFKGKIKIPRVSKNCIHCGLVFKIERWQTRKYCSNACVMQDVGHRPTSPKAARAKAGIRPDISSTLYFFSRWEANLARLFNYLGIKWKFQPKFFDLESQKYTPDFYLPEARAYVEVKNFLNDYSKKRGELFRKKYPHRKLVLLLKQDYLILQDVFAHLIKEWEFS